MSARAILRMAYAQDLVPPHLFGRTQDKTLQARLSEDILNNKDRSAFFRTAPGKFFLRRFISDSTIPKKYRREMIARRRTRDLWRGPALGLARNFLEELSVGNRRLDATSFLQTTYEVGCFDYVDPSNPPPSVSLVWAVAIIRRRNLVLSYRTGRYRDDRDSFANRQSFCFASLVSEDDQTLFGMRSFGVLEAAVQAASVDLNTSMLHQDSWCQAGNHFRHRLTDLIWRQASAASEVLAVVEIEAPDWFEPAQARLSINHLRWINLDVRPNNLDDFDPWSQSLIENCFGSTHEARSREVVHSSA